MGKAASKKRPPLKVNIPELSPHSPETTSPKQNPSLDLQHHLSVGSIGSVGSVRKTQRQSRSHFSSFSRAFIKQQDTKKKPNTLKISGRITASLYIFWKRNVEASSPEKKKEIAVDIYLWMIEKCEYKYNRNYKSMFKDKTIEEISLRLMTMITWLIHSLIKNNDLDLKALGKLHRSYGVKLQFFEAYLYGLHKSLAHYFPSKYSIHIMYCLDRVFMGFVRGIVGKESDDSSDDSSDEMITSTSRFSGISGLKDWTSARSLGASAIWLNNLASCLQSDIGREYYFRFLEQTVCYEIVIFFKLYLEFERTKIEEEKFMLLRTIAKISIDINDISPFPINISHETKQDFIQKMKSLENEWKKQHGHSRCGSMYEPVSPLLFDDIAQLPRLTLPMHASSNSYSSMSSSKLYTSKHFKVPPDFLNDPYQEMKRLTMVNHWKPFSAGIVSMNVSTSQSPSGSSGIKLYNLFK